MESRLDQTSCSPTTDLVIQEISSRSRGVVVGERSPVNISEGSGTPLNVPGISWNVTKNTHFQVMPENALKLTYSNLLFQNLSGEDPHTSTF